MPEHLAELQLSKEIQNKIIEAGVWLKDKGKYAQVKGVPDVDVCTNQAEMPEYTILGMDLISEVQNLIEMKPTRYTILKSHSGGAWLIHKREEVLVYFSEPFGCAKAIYCAPSKQVHVDGGVQFLILDS